MSTTTKIALAVEIAERFMTDNGYSHGPCLGARISGPSGGESWEVEFAYEDLIDRSSTSDPPSILLSVDLRDETVRPLELM